jgi:hypothetical protein
MEFLPVRPPEIGVVWQVGKGQVTHCVAKYRQVIQNQCAARRMHGIATACVNTISMTSKAEQELYGIVIGVSSP